MHIERHQDVTAITFWHCKINLASSDRGTYGTAFGPVPDETLNATALSVEIEPSVLQWDAFQIRREVGLNASTMFLSGLVVK
jgi:hypothetical protein